MQSTDTRLGSTIRQIRAKRGLTQAEAAGLAEMSASYWALIEQGKRSPSLSVIESIADALRVPPSILVFLSTNTDRLEQIDRGVAERMALLAWKLIESPEGDFDERD